MKLRTTKQKRELVLKIIVSVTFAILLILNCISILSIYSMNKNFEPMIDVVSFNNGYKTCLLDIINVMMDSDGSTKEVSKFILTKSNEIK